VNHLLRSLAPISESGWELLDQEARERLAPALGARKLLDFTGPHGWEHSATNLGRTTPLEAGPAPGVTARQRRVLPLVELRAGFSISREELRDADRGADDADLAPLDGAAHQLAAAETAAVFGGYGGVLSGIAEASPHPEPTSGADPDDYAARVAAAIELLLGAGIDGPYGLALGDGEYRRVTAATEGGGGYPLTRHLERIMGGPIVWAPGLTGSVVVSTRGGDFVFDCGQDLSLGYDSHDADFVHLYLEESFSFHVATPEAAVALKP
jgi:uncharacterized linocin/CFP29 family protein